MTRLPGSRPAPEQLEEAVRLLEQELADTNREVMALTLELDKRVEQLRAAEQRYRRMAERKLRGPGAFGRSIF